MIRHRCLKCSCCKELLKNWGCATRMQGNHQTKSHISCRVLSRESALSLLFLSCHIEKINSAVTPQGLYKAMVNGCAFSWWEYFCRWGAWTKPCFDTLSSLTLHGVHQSFLHPNQWSPLKCHDKNPVTADDSFSFVLFGFQSKSPKHEKRGSKIHLAK